MTEDQIIESLFDIWYGKSSVDEVKKAIAVHQMDMNAIVEKLMDMTPLQLAELKEKIEKKRKETYL